MHKDNFAVFNKLIAIAKLAFAKSIEIYNLLNNKFQLKIIFYILRKDVLGLLFLGSLNSLVYFTEQ